MVNSIYSLYFFSEHRKKNNDWTDWCTTSLSIMYSDIEPRHCLGNVQLFSVSHGAVQNNIISHDEKHLIITRDGKRARPPGGHHFFDRVEVMNLPHIAHVSAFNMNLHILVIPPFYINRSGYLRYQCRDIRNHP